MLSLNRCGKPASERQPDARPADVAVQQLPDFLLCRVEQRRDGNRDNNIADNSCSVTNSQLKPWWAVDLGQMSYVETIAVFTENCPSCGKTEYIDFTALFEDYFLILAF